MTPLDDTDEQKTERLTRHSVPLVYSVIKQEGEHELSRAASSLFWSGLTAGFAIFLSLIATGAIYLNMPDHAYFRLIGSFGYSVGFVVVIFGRLQLFTENTITAVIPLLSNYSHQRLIKFLILWGVVFIANLIGVAIVAAVCVFTNTIPPDLTQAIVDLSKEYANRTPLEFFTNGIPAGFIIAAIVWMLPSAKSSKLWIIVMLTSLIYLGDFTHVIAGAGEIFVTVFQGISPLSDTILTDILPTLLGNIIGGTALFTILAYGQVKEELYPH